MVKADFLGYLLEVDRCGGRRGQRLTTFCGGNRPAICR